MKKLVTKIGIVCSLFMLGTTSVITASASSFEPVIRVSSANPEQEFGLSQEQMNKIDKELDKKFGLPGNKIKQRSVTIGAIIAIIVSCIGIAGTSYKLGKYAARQCKIRLGLSTRSYKMNRWYYRATISAAFGVFPAVGFDDYFYGI